ncbi:mammalian cell entry protein [Mycobacterium sp. BMJ-28]
MEDQPADSGDLTTGSQEGPAEVQPTGKAARVAAAEPESAPEPEVDTDGETEPDTGETGEPVLVAHRTAGRALKAAAVLAAVLFVAAGAFAGATAQRYLSDRALVHTKLDIARTASNAITTLWTYTPEDMESLPDRAEKYLAGDFAAQYRQYIDAIVAPNKQAQVSNSTQVLGAAIETINPAQATALVYTNSVATSPVTKNIPSLRYLSYRLTLQHRDSQWLITEMTPVTSLDLTPRL